MYEEHTKDHKKISYKLPLGGVILVIVIVIGFATMQEPIKEYKISVSDAQAQILKRDNSVSPEEAGKILFTKNKQYRFIDLRNPHEFLKGNIDGSINIPSSHLFAKEYEEILSDSTYMNILYSDSHSESCGPWMMLKQTGYNNNYILLGGYSFFEKNILSDFSPKSQAYYDEVAKYDFAKIVSETAGGTVTKKTVKKKSGPKKRKKKAGAQGSC